MRTPLTMIAPGTVYDAVKGNRYNGGYGEFVVIQLDDGRLVRLGHLDQITVKKGERVGANSGPNGTAKVVGFSGQTGLRTGPHLHLDVAKSYDPVSYMVSGTEDPFPFTQGGGLVQGQNVKATGQTQTQTPSAPSGQSSSGQPSQPAPKGRTLSTAQLVALAKQAGFNEKNAVIAAAVAKAESGGDSSNDTIKSGLYARTGETSYGLWQINMTGALGPERIKQLGLSSYKDLYDPVTNARAAFKLSGGSNWSPWSAYNNGKHLPFLAEAQKAAQQGTSQAQVSSSPRSNTSQQITQERQPQPILVPMSPNQSTPQPPPRPPGGDGINFPDVSEDIRSVLEQLQNFSLIN